MTKKYIIKTLSLILTVTMVVSFSAPTYATDFSNPISNVVATEASDEAAIEASAGEESPSQEGEHGKEASAAQASSEENITGENENPEDKGIVLADEIADDSGALAASEDVIVSEAEDTDLVGSGEQIRIDIHYAYIDCDTSTNPFTYIPATFPEGVEVPEYVEGRVGETVYFMVPFPTNIPEGYQFQYMGCTGASIHTSFPDIDYFPGTIVNGGKFYRYTYIISEMDLSEGLLIDYWLKPFLELEFHDGEHGVHFFGSNDPKEYAIDDFFFTDVFYKNSGLIEYSGSLYYKPEDGYVLEGLYYKPDMTEDHLLYRTSAGRGTQIRSEMLTDGVLHVYAKWNLMEADIKINGEDTNYKITYGQTFPSFNDYYYTRYYNIYGSSTDESIEIIPNVTIFDEKITYSTMYNNGNPRFEISIYGGNTSSHKVSFVTGVAEKPIEDIWVGDGKTLKAPDVELNLEGYYLSGWYTDSSYSPSKLFTFGKTAVKSDITLYAKWNPLSCRIIFHTNRTPDETVTKNYTAIDSADEKSRKLTLNNLFEDIEDTSSFLEWSSNDGREYSADQTAEELFNDIQGRYDLYSGPIQLELYAQWKPHQLYTVRFEANLPAEAKWENLKGIYGSAATSNSTTNPWVKESFNEGEAFILAGSEYVLSGFAFTGWKYEKNGKTILVKPTATVMNITDGTTETDFTFVAQWKKVSSYKIIYKLNGGTAGKNKTSVIYKAGAAFNDGLALYNYEKSGTKYDLKAETEQEVKRTGYTFDGWLANDKKYDHYGDDVFENLTLTAQWTPINTYSIEFTYPDGGAILPEPNPVSNVTFDDAFAIKDYLAAMPGYTFKGWTGKVKGKDKLFNLKSKFTLKNLDLPQDKKYVIVANFTSNSYKITYDLAGGKIGAKPTSYKTATGSTKVIPNPKKDGYEFVGWTAVVTDGGTEIARYDQEHSDISSLIDENNKIRTGIYGKVELTANWRPYKYDVIFCENDGTVINNEALDIYKGKLYTDSVDFTEAARIIEAAWETTEYSVKGFAIKENTNTAKYALYKNYKKLGAKKSNDILTLYVVTTPKLYRITYEPGEGTVVKPTNTYKASSGSVRIKTTAQRKGYKFLGWKPKNEDEEKLELVNGYAVAIKAGVAADIKLTAEYEPFRYSVVLMPNAGDVYDQNIPVNKNTGVVYEDGEVTVFSYDSELALSLPSWTRTGYTLKGFSTSAKGKEIVTSLGGLGNGKSATIKLYAVWEPETYTLTYSDVYFINTVGALQYIEHKEFGGEEQLTYGKEFKPKTVSLEGLEFKGWMLISPDSDHWGNENLSVLMRTHNSDLLFYLYVYKVCKDNRCDLTLQAVFDYTGYSVYVNHNGGSYDGEYDSEIAQMLMYPTFKEDISAKLEKYSKEVYRKGYTVQCLSVTKNDKGKIDLSKPVTALGKKNRYGYYDVTVYPIWKKVNPLTPVVTGAHTVTDGSVTTLEMEANIGAYPGFSQVIFEYSHTTTFMYGVKEAVALPEDYVIPENPVTVNRAEAVVTAGKEYYVRVRYGMIDSTGEPYYSPYSKVVRVSKPAAP